MERTILHADLNNFYATVECMYDPRLYHIPMAVSGNPQERHGIILSKNELAKKAGVKTGEALWQARQKCPGIVFLPPRFREYMYFSGIVREIYRRYSQRVEPFGLDEAWIDVTGRDGKTTADEIRDLVRRETGLTISVGVSFNKVFAKLGSDMKKPDATTVIDREHFKELVWPLPVEDLLFVGRATKAKLRRIGVDTIGRLANMHPGVLRGMLGKWGLMLHSYANGLEDGEVARYDECRVVKSVGNSVTPPRNLENDRDVKQMVYVLSESVAARMRAKGFQCAQVSISVRDCQLNTFTRQTALKRPTVLSGEIAAAAMGLFLQHYTWERPIRSMGVCCAKLSMSCGAAQLTCFEDEQKRQRQEQLERAIDGIRQRFGGGVVQRAAVLGSDFKKIDPKEDNVIYPAGFEERREVW